MEPRAVDPAAAAFSRIYQGQPGLIDHILVSHALVERVTQIRAVTDRALPSIADNPNARRTAQDSDHAPVIAHINQ